MNSLRTFIAGGLLLLVAACSDSPTDPGEVNAPGAPSGQFVVTGDFNHTGEITRMAWRFSGWNHPSQFPGPEIIIWAEAANFSASLGIICGLNLTPGTYAIYAYFGPRHEDDIGGEQACRGSVLVTQVADGPPGVFGLMTGQVVIQSSTSSRVTGHIDVTVREIGDTAFKENGRVVRVRTPIDLRND